MNEIEQGREFKYFQASDILLGTELKEKNYRVAIRIADDYLQYRLNLLHISPNSYTANITMQDIQNKCPEYLEMLRDIERSYHAGEHTIDLNNFLVFALESIKCMNDTSTILTNQSKYFFLEIDSDYNWRVHSNCSIQHISPFVFGVFNPLGQLIKIVNNPVYFVTEENTISKYVHFIEFFKYRIYAINSIFGSLEEIENNFEE